MSDAEVNAVLAEFFPPHSNGNQHSTLEKEDDVVVFNLPFAFISIFVFKSKQEWPRWRQSQRAWRGKESCTPR